jgi:hypothetical protein
VASVARRSHSARWRCSLQTTGPNFLRCRYLLSAIGLSWFQRAAKTGTDNAAQLSPAPDLPPRTGFPLSSPHFTMAYFGQCLQTLAATRKRQWPRRGPERVAGESGFCGRRVPVNPDRRRARQRCVAVAGAELTRFSTGISADESSAMADVPKYKFVDSRPPCSKCGRPLMLTRIEPEKPGFDQRTYYCASCRTTETIIAPV